MNRAQIGRHLLAVILIALNLAAPLRAEEALTESTAETRTVLAFQVPMERAKGLLPGGWQVAPADAGPFAGANLMLVLIDQSASQTANGAAQTPQRYGVFVVPARTEGHAKPVSMVVGGLAPEAVGPGAYGVYETAQVGLQRTRTADSGGKTNASENWKFLLKDGSSLEIHLAFTPATLTRARMDVPVFSARLPAFHRTYRVDQWSEIVKGDAIQLNHTQELTLQAQGTAMGRYLSGNEKVLGISSVPIYQREIYVDPTLPLPVAKP